jgi:acetyl-CoA carboxylase biotin carboxyl carrier protein
MTSRKDKGEAARPAVDKRLIRDLAELLAETGLSEIEWSEGGVQVRVARQIGVAAGAAAAPGPAAAAPAAAPPAAAAPAAEAADISAHPGAVKSPMVGTAYVAPEPGAAPFVHLNDQVREGQTLLIVEAMKTMNPIPAPRSGRLVRILIENQQPVEYGQVLMLIE